MTDPTPSNGGQGQWPSASTPRNTGKKDSNSTQHPFSSSSSSSSALTSTRLHISHPSLVSNRGRKKGTPTPAPPRPPLSTATTSTGNGTSSMVSTSSNKKATPTPSSSTNNSDGKKKKPKKFVDWPPNSADALPKLSDHLVQGLQQKNLEFPINEECTSLKLSPSGRLMIACFSDGTIRLFDLTGTFAAQSGRSSTIVGASKTNSSSKAGLEEGLFDMDSSSSSEEEEIYRTDFSSQQEPSESPSDSLEKRGGRNRYVLSKEHQRYGTVLAQIHARGVITSLLMDVDISEDGQYCFGGALRGSQDVVCVYLGGVEEYLDQHLAQQQQHTKEQSGDGGQTLVTKDLLDLITVYRYSDAKLRGFGACTRLRNGRSNPPHYLLFTGRAIKNIHIWKFEPPMDPSSTKGHEDAGKWSLLYDAQTNGNTINLLQFRYDPNGLLQGISKSGDQKLRLWDLSYEQHLGNSKNPFYSRKSVIEKLATQQQKMTIAGRPKRPPYCDVTSSETTESICGGFAVCCGDNTYNQISFVKLDVADVNSPFNHTELALPGSTNNGASMVRSRRQQRGELKTITNVAGMNMDPSTVLFEVSDGSIVQYSDGSNSANGQPKIEPASFSVGAALSTQDGSTRKLCVGKMGAEGVVAAAISCYNSNNSRGSILLRTINEDALSGEQRQKGFWGFSQKKRKKGTAAVPGRDETPKASVAVQQQQVNHQTVMSHHQTVMSPHPNTNITQWTNPPSAVQATPAQKGATAGVQLFAGSDHPTKDYAKTTLAPMENKKAAQKVSKPTPAQQPLSAKKKRKATVVPESSVKKTKMGQLSLKEVPRNLQLPAASASSNKKPRQGMNVSPEQTPVAVKNATIHKKESRATLLDLAEAAAASNDSQLESEKDSQRQASSCVATSATKTTPTGTSTLKPKPVDRIPETPTDTPEKLGAQPAVNCQLVSEALEGVKEVSPDSKASGTSARVVSAAKTSNHSRPCIPISVAPTKPSAEVAKQVDSCKGVTKDNESGLKNESSTAKRGHSDSSSGNQDGKSDSKVAKTTANSDVSTSATTHSGDKPPKPPKAASKATAKKSLFANRQALVQLCAEKEVQLSRLAQQHLPSPPVEERMGLTNVTPSSTTLSDLAAGQELARMKLAAQHRAEHELVLKRILEVAQDAVKDLSQAKSLAAVDEAEENFQECFKWHYDNLDEAIWRQSEAAQSLAVQQRWENGENPVPYLHVSFPFYGVFNEVVECIDAITSTVRSG